MKQNNGIRDKNGVSNSLKAGVWYTVCNVILKGATMLLAPVYARILSLSEYGFYSTITTWFSMLGTVVTGDLSASVPRGKYEFPGNLDSFVSSITFLGSIITFTCYIFVLIFKDFICALFGCGIEFFHVQFLLLLVSPALGMLQNKARLDNRYKLSVSLSLGCWLLSTVITIAFLIFPSFRASLMGSFMSDRVLAMVVGNAIPTLCVCAVIYVGIMTRGRVLYNKQYWKFALTLSLPLVPHLLAGNILSHSDRIMITKICGEEYTALYSITYSCSAVISMLFNSLNQAWVPWFNEQYYKERNEIIHDISSLYCSVFFILTILAILLGPEMLLVFGGYKYMDAVNIMPVVMVSCFCQFTNAFFVNVELFEKKTTATAVGTCIAAGLNICLNLAWMPIMGYKAGAYTTLIGFLFLHLYHNSINHSLIKERLNRIYPMRLIRVYILITLVLICISSFLYSHTLIRMFISVIIIAFSICEFFKHKTKLIELTGKKT